MVRAREHELAGLEARLRSLEELDAVRGRIWRCAARGARAGQRQGRTAGSDRRLSSRSSPATNAPSRPLSAILLQHVIVEKPEQAAAGSISDGSRMPVAVIDAHVVGFQLRIRPALGGAPPIRARADLDRLDIVFGRSRRRQDPPDLMRRSIRRLDRRYVDRRLVRCGCSGGRNVGGPVVTTSGEFSVGPSDPAASSRETRPSRDQRRSGSTATGSERAPAVGLRSSAEEASSARARAIDPGDRRDRGTHAEHHRHEERSSARRAASRARWTMPRAVMHKQQQLAREHPQCGGGRERPRPCGRMRGVHGSICADRASISGRPTSV